MISWYDYLHEIRSVTVGNYHLNLVFLGDVEYVLLSSLNLELEQILTYNKAVTIRFSEISLFPFSDTPKVIAVMLEQSDELMKLQHYIVKCIREFVLTL